MSFELQEGGRMNTISKAKALEVLGKLMSVNMEKVNGPLVNGVRLLDNWDPISDPLTTFRMSLALRLDVNFSGAWVYVSRDEDFDSVAEPAGQFEDVEAAACRAIVRAALALALGHSVDSVEP